MCCVFGKCPTIDVLVGDVTIKCLLDAGSNVSTITETFFVKHFCPTDRKTNCKWLSLSVANGLGIPHLGYVETGVCTQGRIIKHR